MGRFGQAIVSRPVRGGLLGLMAMLTVVACAAGPGRASDPHAPALSPEAAGVSQLVTAAGLADWGRAHDDPGALIMAARIVAEVPLRNQGNQPPLLTFEGLLNEAEAMAAGQPAYLAAIEQVRGQTVRGVVSSPFGRGPIATVKDVRARETFGFEVDARGGEILRIAAIGDGDTNIDLIIRDADGRLLCQDGFGDHYPVCTLMPRVAGKVRVSVVNRGEIWTKVQILSN
ncbi:hypothetical protein [Brevundimonas sp.]|uniref:hypothetical protein n=1 Tax=Brevundimonas sp. TaxID=1871086 RepID=UPI001D824273|nr:hypothetical protein [Brevundimonas sp.]MBL0947920.1 hypothetical protein [Brevundimonas sp.]